MATAKELCRNGRVNHQQAQVGSSADRTCACDLIKSKKDGQTDWKTLANIITANLLGEILCASYADYKYGRRTKDFRPDIDWKFSYEENDVLVFTKQNSLDQKVISFMGRSVIDLPVCSVAAVLQKLENFHLWNKFMIESKEVQLLSESDSHCDIIGYFLHETKRCLLKTKRDMVLFIHSDYTTGRFIQSAISVDHPSCPPVKGIIRAECCLGSGWVVEPYEGQKSKSLVSFVCNVDMKGLIPPLILSRFLQRQPLAIHYLRECVMEEARKQRPNHVRFSFRKSRIGGTENRTEQDSSTSENKENQDSMSSIEFGSNTCNLGSFLFVNSSKQYEDPVGISEFIGYNTAPRVKKKQGRRHRCCQSSADLEYGTGTDSFFSSGSCEECGTSHHTLGGSTSTSRGRNSNYITR